MNYTPNTQHRIQRILTYFFTYCNNFKAKIITIIIMTKWQNILFLCKFVKMTNVNLKCTIVICSERKMIENSNSRLKKQEKLTNGKNCKIYRWHSKIQQCHLQVICTSLLYVLKLRLSSIQPINAIRKYGVRILNQSRNPKIQSTVFEI